MYVVLFVFPDAIGLMLTSRTDQVKQAWDIRLDMDTKITDHLLLVMKKSSENSPIGHLYPSPEILTHSLKRYRDKTKIQGEFMDELQFYTDVIGDIVAGVASYSPRLSQGNLEKWMSAYYQLMGAANYLGVEQTLCSILYSIICFSHQETFYYANLTYSAEAAFSGYRQIYPGDRGGDWRSKDRNQFIPSLTMCRREVFADLYYQGMNIDPMKCDYSRRNETHFLEASQIIIKENHTIISYIALSLENSVNEAYTSYMLYLMISGGIGCYFVLMHLFRCSCIKCIQTHKRRAQRQQQLPSDDEIDAEPLAVKQTSLDTQKNHVTFAEPIHCGHLIRTNSQTTSYDKNHVKTYDKNHMKQYDNTGSNPSPSRCYKNVPQSQSNASPSRTYRNVPPFKVATV